MHDATEQRLTLLLRPGTAAQQSDCEMTAVVCVFDLLLAYPVCASSKICGPASGPGPRGPAARAELADLVLQFVT